jgi:hypothetical protein
MKALLLKNPKNAAALTELANADALQCLTTLMAEDKKNGPAIAARPLV